MCLRRIVYVLSCQQSAGETGGRRLVVYVLVLKILLWTQDEAAMAGFLVLVPAVEVRPGVARPVSRFQWACTGTSTNRRILLPLAPHKSVGDRWAARRGKEKGAKYVCQLSSFSCYYGKNNRTSQIFRCTNDSVAISQSLVIHSFSFSEEAKKRRKTQSNPFRAPQGLMYYNNTILYNNILS